jgi:putative DNA methylase
MERRRKLIEVALPLAAISQAATREKATPLGHPSTLHLWWARRPLAACRAVLLAQLIDDPSAHPGKFPTEEAQAAERERLLSIIERALKWDSPESALSAARAEVERSFAGDPPFVVDPFAGGGSIPLTAQQLGLRVEARDLNPVAVMISKCLIEFPAVWSGEPPVNPTATMRTAWVGAQGLADDVRYYGAAVLELATERLCELYPPVRTDSGIATPIAWLWARTVRCPNPACGVRAPLLRSLWLAKAKGKGTWLKPTVDNDDIRFSVESGIAGPSVDGTVTRTGARCLACGTAISLEYVRSEGRSGRIDQRMVAVVTEGHRRRVYVEPANADLDAANCEPLPILDTALPDQALGFRVQAYGMTRYSDLFTARQLRALDTFVQAIAEVGQAAQRDAEARSVAEASAYACAVEAYLSLALNRLAMTGSSLVRWNPVGEKAQHMFGRQTVSMVWDFAEPNFTAGATGGFGPAVELVARPLERLGRGQRGTVVQADATRAPLPENCVVATDPPYYDNVGYADLSDVFYVWMRLTLRDCYPDLTSTLTTPKAPELVADPFRHGGKAGANHAFEAGFSSAFELIERAQRPDVPLTVFYAFKQSEETAREVASTGWETMLEGLVKGGFAITGTWPIRTEMVTRMRGMGSNALASSIVLVCRRRTAGADVTDRRAFLLELRRELPAALRALQSGSVAPVDLAQSAIGPGMAVFSRYQRVLEADGAAMTVRTALGLINQVLDETLSEQEGDFDSETRWAVAWFEQHGMNPGPFGVAETLSKAKNTAINGLVAAGILESKAGKVRLLDRTELPDGWDPAADARLTVWELAQNLIRALESGGENEAAELLRRIGGLGETARELAYRLYVICERKKWAKEALAYNALVVAWPEISRLAAAAPAPSGAAQQELL